MEHGISDVPLWHGETKFVKPTAETTISLSQIEVIFLFHFKIKYFIFYSLNIKIIKSFLAFGFFMTIS